MSEPERPTVGGLSRREFYSQLAVLYFVLLGVFRGPGSSEWGNIAFGVALAGAAVLCMVQAVRGRA